MTDDLNMDFSLTDEQEALVGALTGILADRATPERLKECDGSERWHDLDLWHELAKADLLGVAVPAEHGGLGYGILELCLLAREVGRFVAPVPFVASTVSAVLPVAKHGTPEQRAELAPIATGERITTTALIEAGADPEHPLTRAERDGDGWRITGEKTLVPAANVAFGIITPAAVGDEVGMFFVPAQADGVTIERQETMGLEPHFLVRYDRVHADDFFRIGALADGRAILRETIQHTTVALCAVAAGVASQSLKITAEYTTNRKQFDRAIATFQAVESRLADAYIHAEAMWLTVLLAATRLAEGKDAPLEVNTAKYWAAEGGDFVGHTSLHCHGGISIDLDYPIHRYFLWAKQLEFTLGAVPQSLRRIGQVLATTP